MTKDRKIVYIMSLAVLAALLIVLFVDIGSSKMVTACLLLPLTPTVMLLIKKRSSSSIHKREVLLLSAAIGVIYVILIQLTGAYFGFLRNPYLIDTDKFFKFVLPITITIVSTELIRHIFLSQKNKLASFLTFLSCVLAEALMFSNLSGITTFNKFMDLIGLTVFPAISANIYYHYSSKHFGALPNIVFRLITTLYIYFLPNVAAMTDALNACIKIVLPIIMLLFISALYEKKIKKAVNKGRPVSVIAMILVIALMGSVAMLISCQFRYGALVIATESMTGEINKGDMIIYESYDGQIINEGQVIVFKNNKSRIVHRVVKIEIIGGERRFYTKGDANPGLDPGYITEADIVGLTDVKIAYVGYPTLWLRSLIN